jgi:hypothetical protein
MYRNRQKMYGNGQKYSKILEENLVADYADDSDLIGHEKAKNQSKIRDVKSEENLQILYSTLLTKM